MKLSATREDLLGPLQSVIGVVERRQTMPVLANVLLVARSDKLAHHRHGSGSGAGGRGGSDGAAAGEITVPGRKLLDIVRTLPEKVERVAHARGEKIVIKAGRSRFTLSSLPATEFPVIEDINAAADAQAQPRGSSGA